MTPDNPRLADEYGIVMGTSHQDPMNARVQRGVGLAIKAGSLGNWNFRDARTSPDRLLEGAVKERGRFRKTSNNDGFCVAENDTAMVQGQAEKHPVCCSGSSTCSAQDACPDGSTRTFQKVPQVWTPL
jgi:hypothetical protein